MPNADQYRISELTTRVEQVVQRVRSAEKRFGRKSGAVQILPVSKTRPSEDIEHLVHSGFSEFGENYLQEAQKKMSALASLNLRWHFIGPVQSNKTHTIATLFHWVHSVDREKIARRLNDQRPENLPPLNICLQINISGEQSKSGVQPSSLLELASTIMDFPRLRLRGLMVLPAPTPDFEGQRQAFKATHELFTSLKRELGNKNSMLDTLSMGMSSDLEAAIAEGSTLVRIGTDIFGPRTSAQISC